MFRHVKCTQLMWVIFWVACEPNTQQHQPFFAFSAFSVSPADFRILIPVPSSEQTPLPRNPQEQISPPSKTPTTVVNTNLGCHRIRHGRFGDQSIEETLRALQTAFVLEIIPSHTAGRTIKATLHLDGGWRAFFKPWHPDLIFARPKSEVGAYRLNRLLGCNHVPPAVLRYIDAQRLRHAFERNRSLAKLAQLDREVIPKGEVEILGAMLIWVDKADVWEPPMDVLKVMETADAPIPEQWESLVWDLSWMFVLDFLTNNYDRMTGGNILRRRANGRLVFIDNGAGFGRDKPWKLERRLATLKYLTHHHDAFRNALEKLNLPLLQECLGDVVFNWELREVLTRRDALLDHFRELETKHPNSLLKPVATP